MPNLSHKTGRLQYSSAKQQATDQELNSQPNIEEAPQKPFSRSCVIPYHPRLGETLGSVYAAILLQQAYHRYRNNGNKPFYKFLAPCSNDYYRRGDSWIEELSFTSTQLNRGIEIVATRISSTRKKQGANRDQVLSIDRVELNAFGKMSNSNALVLYWTNRDRRTWWMVNLPLFSSLLEVAHISNLQNDHQQVAESSISLLNSSLIRFPHAEITTTERSTEELLSNSKVHPSCEDSTLNGYARTVAGACSIALNLCSHEIAYQVSAAAGSFQASGYSLEEIVLVGHWWKNYFWKGQSGTPPRPNDLLDMYGAANDFYSNERGGDCCRRFIEQWRSAYDLEAERVSRGD